MTDKSVIFALKAQDVACLHSLMRVSALPSPQYIIGLSVDALGQVVEAIQEQNQYPHIFSSRFMGDRAALTPLNLQEVAADYVVSAKQTPVLRCRAESVDGAFSSSVKRILTYFADPAETSYDPVSKAVSLSLLFSDMVARRMQSGDYPLGRLVSCAKGQVAFEGPARDINLPFDNRLETVFARVARGAVRLAVELKTKAVSVRDPQYAPYRQAMSPLVMLASGDDLEERIRRGQTMRACEAWIRQQPRRVRGQYRSAIEHHMHDGSEKLASTITLHRKSAMLGKNAYRIDSAFNGAYDAADSYHHYRRTVAQYKALRYLERQRRAMGL